MVIIDTQKFVAIIQAIIAKKKNEATIYYTIPVILIRTYIQFPSPQYIHIEFTEFKKQSPSNSKLN